MGERSSNLSRWSEDYQRVVDRLNAEVAIQDPNIAGISLWQYADIKVDQSNTSTGRPGGINNKGVVSRFRSPKLAAEAVAAIFAGKVV